MSSIETAIIEFLRTYPDTIPRLRLEHHSDNYGKCRGCFGMVPASECAWQRLMDLAQVEVRRSRTAR